MQVSFCLVGRHQQREQQVDRLIVDRVEGDGGFQLDKNADSTQRILFQFSVGNGDTIADPGTAHFSRVRIASNTTCGGKLNCLAASSLMISEHASCSGSARLRVHSGSGRCSVVEPNRCSS